MLMPRRASSALSCEFESEVASMAGGREGLRLPPSRKKEKAETKQEHNALSHITRDILQQCSEEFRPGPEPLGRQDMRIGR